MTGQALDDLKIAAAIDVLGLGVDAAEFHGGICGLLCSSGPGAVGVWIRHSGSAPTGEEDEVRIAREHLHDAEAETWRRLSEPAFEFEPLLPAGEADLAERVAALAIWCQGYVTGLGLGGLGPEALQAQRDETAKFAEIIADLVEISRASLGTEDLADAASADFDLAELIEYVRAVAQIVFDDLQACQAPINQGLEFH